MKMKENPKEFFEGISSEYDEVFKKLVPPFPQMLQTMFDYLPQEFKPQRVLELGCGTGNLTKVISTYWPNCDLTVVDISKVMLEKTREKTQHKNLKLIESSFADVEFDSKSFDLVTSSLAIHHIKDLQKQKLIGKIIEWLSPKGVFVFNDCVRAESERLYRQAEKEWVDLALAQGLTRTQMDLQIEHHRNHDHYPVLLELANWLKQAGFREVDVLWRRCIWAVLYAGK
jgi:tRNA (cmo5U34)-methyltransferase